MFEQPDSRHNVGSHILPPHEKLELVKTWDKHIPKDLVPFLASDSDTRYKAYQRDTVEGMGLNAKEIMGERESLFKGFFTDDVCASSVAQVGVEACG